MSKKLKIGDAAPDAEAPATTELNFKLSNHKSKSNLVLYFYPKDSTPGCTIEGKDFRDRYELFKGLDTEIFGVSKDSMKRHENFKAKQEFPFELISDIDSDICEQFGVWQLKKTFGKEYMGIVRSTFLIDKQGIIQKIWENIRVKNHADDVLKAVQALPSG